MIKHICLCSVFTFFVIEVFAQQKIDTIAMRQSLGVTFQMHGRMLKPRQLLSHTKPYDEAYALMRKAKTNYDVASVFSFAGGFLIGWPIGTAIGGGEPNWTLAGIGAGLVVISIPFSSAYGKHAKHAVRIYNRGQKASDEDDVGMDLGWTSQGMTLRFTF